jgi:hypothetical protein
MSAAGGGGFGGLRGIRVTSFFLLVFAPGFDVSEAAVAANACCEDDTAHSAKRRIASARAPLAADTQSGLHPLSLDVYKLYSVPELAQVLLKLGYSGTYCRICE